MPVNDVGVPGALADGLRRLADHVPPSRIDHLWIFPPFVRGRVESGVIAAACFTDGERRLLVTLAYRARETGRGITFEPRFQEEGEAPGDRLPDVIEGVGRRTEGPLGSPRSVPVGGDETVFLGLVEELSPQEVAP